MILGRRFSNRRLNRWLRGEASLGGLLRLNDRDREALWRAASRRVEAEDFEAARRLFGLLGELWPEQSADTQLGLGVCAQRQGRLEDAERAYDAVLEAQPGNPYALTNRAEVKLLTGRHEDARADLAAALGALEGRNEPDALRKRIEALQAVGSRQ